MTMQPIQKISLKNREHKIRSEEIFETVQVRSTKWIITDRLMPFVRYFPAFQWLPLLFTSCSSQFQRIAHFDQKQSIQYNCCVLDSNAKWRYTFLFIIENRSIPDIQKWENKSQYWKYEFLVLGFFFFFSSIVVQC